MPIHINNLTSRVQVGTGELPFTDEQLTRLVELIASRLATQAKQDATAAEDTELRRSAAPPSPVVE